MSSYGFGKKPARPAGDTLDLSGITRTPMPLDPAREEAAIARGAALGFTDRGGADTTVQGQEARAPQQAGAGGEPVRRRRRATPQASLYIKGPKDILDWFVDHTNRRGHRSYWQTLEELRAMVERAGDQS